MKSPLNPSVVIIFLWCEQIKGQGSGLPHQRPPGATDGDFVFYPAGVDWSYNQQIHIAVPCGFAVGVGTEKDDLVGVELLDQDLQVRPQLVGDPVDRVAWVQEDILTDSGR